MSFHRDGIGRSARLLAALGGVAAWLLGSTAEAAISQFYTASGQVSVSADGAGSLSATYNIRAEKPSAGATVRNAFLMAATTGLSGATLTNTDIQLAGTNVTFTSTVPSTVSSNNYLGEVTSIVKPTLDAAAAGITTLTVSEGSKSASVDGTALVVVWNDPAQIQTRTVILLFGVQQVAGDTFSITLASPIDPAATGALLDMGLGISFSFQGTVIGRPAAGVPLQFSIVDVNGARLTSSAGGEDDGGSVNGELITVGGIGDSNANPPDPNAPPTNDRSDDELYSLLPFTTRTSTTIQVFTQNPSNDDNIFFAYFEISGAAIVGEGIVLAPATATNPAGTTHTVSATVVSAAGGPIPGKTVTFNVLSGPNAGVTGTAVTDASGVARFTYASNGLAGTDRIQASFFNSHEQTQTSNIVTKTWTFECRAISLSPSTLPNGALAAPYSQTVTASGGTAPYSFAVTSGSLPAGLTLSSSGLISGTPTAAGTSTFEITATDSTDAGGGGGCTGTRPYSITIGCSVLPLPPITAPSTGTVGQPLIASVPLHAGSTYRWDIAGTVITGQTSNTVTITPDKAGPLSLGVSETNSFGCSSPRNEVTINVAAPCSPAAPQSVKIAPIGNPDGPVTGIDFLDLSWSPPSALPIPASYDWRINGDALANTTSTSIQGAQPRALVTPGHANDPIQLFVFARACTPELQGQPGLSPIYIPSPPQASFNVLVSGSTVTVTDTSSPQATSWVWLWGDGTDASGQAPGSHTYAAKNVYTITLIATNGAGSSVATQPAALQAAAAAASRMVTRTFDASDFNRHVLSPVPLTGSGQKWLRLIAAEETEEKVVYLRLTDEKGDLVLERRLAMAPEQTEAFYNLEAFGLIGTYSVEVVSDHPVTPSFIEPALPRSTRRIVR